MAIFQRSGGDSNNKFNQGVSNALGRVNTKSVLRYTMMPEILPRIRALGFHFGHFAYLLALVFSSARLIPATHPVMNAANIGRYGVRQVIAMAANNITWSRNNIDQIAIFTAIVMGLIMIVIQAGLIAFAALVGFNPAQAQTVDSFFVPGAPYVAANDPVMILFANVFGGLDNFWGAGVAGAAPNSGNIIHDAVRAMLKLYSMAMMVIAVIIVIYYIMTVVGEAAKTGTPFGQRFNSLWAPIRLVIALGLLVPLGSGLNSAQYLTLWIAKMGSGLGTQVWATAMRAMDTSDADRFILDEFGTQWVREFAFKVFLMEVCMQAHNRYNDVGPGDDDYVRIRPVDLPDTPELYRHRIHYDDVQRGYRGTHCGTIDLSMSEADIQGSISATARAVPVEQIFQESMAAMQSIVNSSVIRSEATRYVNSVISVNRTFNAANAGLVNGVLDQKLDDIMAEADRIEIDLRQRLASAPNTDMAGSMQEFIDSRANSWVYAGTFYMEISRIIQASHDATLNAIPNAVMVDIEGQEYTSTTGYFGFGDEIIKGTSVEVTQAVQIIENFYRLNRDRFISIEDVPESCQGLSDEPSGTMEEIGCFLFSILVPDNLIMLASDDSRDVDPMAALIKAGYEIVSRSWVALLIGFGASALSFIPFIGGFAQALGSLAIVFATFGLAAGMILYFMLPVFPFMYFFFAVVSWIMEIFEAIIAMPLWALAHLRIDGEGMPGQAAINGYYLLLAILLRPALIVMGLIAGIVIFSAVTFLLQTLWADVLFVKSAGNMSGLEVLVYTVVFAYFCYSAALTSFKLVDTIPNQILRWIGSGTPTFSDGKEDPMGQSNALLTGGASFLAGQGIQGASQGMASAGKGAAEGVSAFRNRGVKKEAENTEKMRAEITNKEHQEKFPEKYKDKE